MDDDRTAPGPGAAADRHGPGCHQGHGRTRREVRLRRRWRSTLHRGHQGRDLALRDLRPRSSLDPRERQARSRLGGPAHSRRRLRHGLQPGPHRRDRLERQGQLHVLLEPQEFRRGDGMVERGRTLRLPQDLQSPALWIALLPAAPGMARLQPHRPRAEARSRRGGAVSAGHQASQEALRAGPHGGQPGLSGRNPLRSHQGPCRRPLRQPQPLPDPQGCAPREP